MQCKVDTYFVLFIKQFVFSNILLLPNIGFSYAYDFPVAHKRNIQFRRKFELEILKFNFLFRNIHVKYILIYNILS